MMAQRALPNPYADYDKSLATSYFDAAGRVSGAGARRGGCGDLPHRDPSGHRRGSPAVPPPGVPRVALPARPLALPSRLVGFVSTADPRVHAAAE